MRADQACMALAVDRRNWLRLAGLLGVSLVVPGTLKAASASWSSEQRALVAEVAEMIIPVTDTGGAKAAGVPVFVEMMVANWFDEDEQANFTAGMSQFAKGAVVRYGKSFVDLDHTERTAYLAAELAAAEALPGGSGHSRTPFAALMKRLTIFGYYTSELGGSIELALNIIPNEYCPDARMKPGARADSFIPFSLSPFSGY